MMHNLKDDSGPAFPRPASERVGDPRDHAAQTGMTLRDYYAAQAMQSYIRECPGADFERIADLAWAMADAMLTRLERV